MSGRSSCGCRSVSAWSRSPQAPQAFVRVRVRLADGREGEGISAELLVPKWFDKSPALTNEDNFDQLRRSLDIARQHAARCRNRYRLRPLRRGRGGTSCGLRAGRPQWPRRFVRACAHRARDHRRARPARTRVGVRTRAQQPHRIDGSDRARPRGLRFRRFPRETCDRHHRSSRATRSGWSTR